MHYLRSMSRRAHLTFRLVALLTLFVVAVWPHPQAPPSHLAARTAVTARAELLSAAIDVPTDRADEDAER
jgi:hypothetical protein